MGTGPRREERSHGRRIAELEQGYNPHADTEYAPADDDFLRYRNSESRWVPWTPRLIARHNNGAINCSSQITVDFTASLFADSDLATYSAGEWTFQEDCLIIASAQVTISMITTGPTNRTETRFWGQIDTGSGFALINSWDSYAYHSNGTSANTGNSSHALIPIPIQISDGDKLRFRANRTGGTGSVRLLPSTAHVTIQKVAGF